MTKGGITMKKIFFACICTALAVMTSCDLQLIEPIDSDMENSKDTVVTQVVFNIDAKHPDDLDTKAVKTSWETNDVIFVFFSNQTAPAYLELKWNGSKWVATSHGLSFTSNEAGMMRAVYLPFGSDATVTADGTNYKFSTTYYAYYLTSSLSYALNNGSIDGTFNMQIPDGYVQFFVEKSNQRLEGDLTLPFELREPHLTPMGVVSVAADGKVNTSSLAHGAPMPGYDYKDGFLFSGILEENARNEAIGYMFTMVQGGGNGNYYRMGFHSNPVTLYTSSSTRRAVKFTMTSISGLLPSARPVDMGTEVNGKRIYWHKTNLGEGGETDYGKYYAFGETNYKNDYSWSTYKYCNGAENSITKYCALAEYWGGEGQPDNINELLPEDDAAYQAFTRQGLGYGRTPTIDEWIALINNCTWTHQENWNNSGKSGMLATSNITGNYLFFPDTGWKLGTTSSRVGEYGMYSSASSAPYRPDCQRSVLLNQNGNGLADTGLTSKYCGLPIRPVSD